MIGTWTLLQGAHGLLGDTDKATDHYIPARREGHWVDGGASQGT